MAKKVRRVRIGKGELRHIPVQADRHLREGKVYCGLKGTFIDLYGDLALQCKKCLHAFSADDPSAFAQEYDHQ